MALDYIYNKKNSNTSLYYSVGGIVVMVVVLILYFSFRQDTRPKINNLNIQEKTSSMSEDQKLSILQTLNQTSDKTKTLSETDKLNLLNSLH